MAKIVLPPNEDYSIATIRDNVKLFLAGGITNCGDWQADAIKELSGYNKLTIYNPRRADYSPDNEQQQICWEFDKLSNSDLLVFWFAPETVCPITLYELGYYCNATQKPAVIGVDRDYIRKNDVIIQTSLARPDLDIYEGFGPFMNRIHWQLIDRFKVR